MIQDARRQLVDDLVADALDLAACERAGFLLAACASDAALWSEANSLITEAEQQGILDTGLNYVGLQPHEIIGDRFRILRLIGRGGMGDVYEALDLALHQHVALKTIRAAIASRPEMIARFKREVQIGKTVTDSHLSRVYDLAHHSLGPGSGQLVFMTMELLSPGETLQELLARRGHLPVPEALEIACQIASGLGALHSHGYLHRDLKPSNVMLVYAGEGRPVRAVITDLGLARSLGASTVSGAHFERSGHSGTPDYMAPEQMTGGLLSRSTDLYSLGVILHEMIRGRTPQGDRQIHPVAARCLAPRPEKRLQTADEFVASVKAHSSAWPKLVWVAAATLIVSLGLTVWQFGSLRQYRPRPAAARWYEQGLRAERDGINVNAMRAFQRSVDLDKDFALAHARLAESAASLGFENKAKSEAVLAAAPGLTKWFRDPEEDLRVRAASYVVNKDYKHAAEMYQSLVNSSSGTDKAPRLIDLGQAVEKAGDVPAAIRYYQQAAKDDPQYGAAFLRLGTAYRKQSDLKNAVSNLDASENIYRLEGNAEGLTDVLYRKAEILSSANRIEEARPLMEQALAFARSSGNDYLQAQVLLSLSHCLYMSGNVRQGEARAREAVDLAQRKGIQFLAASGLIDIGNALYVHGDYTSAEPIFRSAVETATDLQLAPVKARALFCLGSLLLTEGDIERGLPPLHDALRFYEANGYKGESAKVLLLLSRASRQSGDYATAKLSLEKSLNFSRRTNDESGVALAEDGLGGVTWILEDFPAALSHFTRSVESNGKLHDSLGLGYALASRASVFWSLGRYGEAAEDLSRATTMAHEDNHLVAAIVLEEAGMKLSEGRYALAGSHLKSAELLADKEDLATQAQLDQIGCLLNARQNKPQVGLQFLREGGRPGREESCSPEPDAGRSRLWRSRIAQSTLSKNDRNPAATSR